MVYFSCFDIRPYWAEISSKGGGRLREKIVIILTFLFVFIVINYCYAFCKHDDWNCDGKKDVTMVDREDCNRGCYQRGEEYKYAEFDTNFDGNMDIIINFNLPFGSLKRDSDFDGKFEITSKLIHISPSGVVSTPWPGRLDTWHVVSLSKTLSGYLIDSYAVAEENYILTIKKLIKNGLDIDVKDANGDTLLMRIVKNGYLEIAKLLISNGANVNVKNNAGITVLMQAVDRGFPELARLNVSIGVLIGRTAVEQDNPELVKLLIEKGADVNAKDKDGYTALMRAIKKGYLEIARALINNNADVNVKSNDGFTPLMQAIKRHYLEAAYLDLIKLLIESKADLNTQDNNGLTALMMAMPRQQYYPGELDPAKLLIENGADVNVRANDGSTVLLQIAKDYSLPAAKLLISNGADVNARNNEGESVLMVAVKCKGNNGIPKLLVENGVDINAKNKEGLTVLMERAKKFDFQMVDDLLEIGADAETKDVNGDTILIQFIKGGYPDKTEYFLAFWHFDLDVKNNEGMTPLMYAVEKGYSRLVKIMTEKGADVNIKNNNGQTAFDIALKKGNNDIISLLTSVQSVRQSNLTPEQLKLSSPDINLHNINISSILFTPNSPKVGDSVIINVNITNRNSVPISSLNVVVNDQWGWGNRETVDVRPFETKDIKLIISAKEMQVKQNPHMFQIFLILGNKSIRKDIQVINVERK